MTTAPKITGFEYILVPADPTAPLRTIPFSGSDDDALRDEIARYFQQTAITSGQRRDFHQSVMEKVTERGATGKDLTANMLENTFTKFEIVPVIMPTRHNGFIGTSLYVDEVGRFKELRLNDRASRIAQRDIRGDAFVLRNHDDPAVEEWSRVTTSITDVEELIQRPPPVVPDPMASAAPLQSASTDNVVLSHTDVETALALKKDGNDFFHQRRFQDAVRVYTEALGRIQGRDDRLESSDKATILDVYVSLRLNRAQCCLKLGEWSSAVGDSTAVLEQRLHLKALYIRCTANMHLNEFEACHRDLDSGLSLARDDEEFLQLRESVRAAETAFQQEQRQKYRRLFD